MRSRLLKVCILTIFIFVAFVTNAFANSKLNPEPYNLKWSGRTAKWQVEGYATKYQVELYRDGNRVTTKTTTDKSISFSSQMSRGEHDYFFRVRAYNKESKYWSDWEDSNIKTIYESESKNSVGSNAKGAVVVGAAPGQDGSITSNSGTWSQRSGVWFYQFKNGTYPQNTWLNINGKWYYFNANGSIATGWLNDNGKFYYLNPDGSMLTGTVIFDGITHFFDSTGVMIY